MTKNSLETCIEGVRSAWEPLSSKLVDTTREQLGALLTAPAAHWLTQLRQEMPENRELHRDASGFLLLAHAERNGQYRAPHDHGRGWVVYGVQDGEIEMSTYLRLQDPDGTVRLVRRGCAVMRPGDVQAFLPGDIHDTRCLSTTALYYRLTDRDLQSQEEARWITRYV